MRPGQRGSDFDGTNDYLVLTGVDLTGDADSKVGISSTWIRIDGGDGAAMKIIGNSGSYFYFEREINNKFHIRSWAAGAWKLDLATTQTYTADATWLHLLASWDVANAKGHFYVNDADVTDANILLDVLIDYTRPGWSIGATYATWTAKFNSVIAELYFNPATYLDITVESNRRKFISDTGKPVNLGPDGSWPTGTAPILYMPRVDGLNLGTGGNFTAVGSPYLVTGPGGINPKHKVARG